MNKFRHSKIMYLLAYEHCVKYLGSGHILAAEYALKLGSLLLAQGEHIDALNFYVEAYQTLSAQSDSFLSDIKDCLCGLSLCYFRQFKFVEAERYCTLLIDVSTSEKGNLGFEEVRYLTLLSDVKERLIKSSEALQCLDLAWSIMMKDSEKPQSGGILINIGKRCSKLLMTTLSMRHELLMNNFRGEFDEYAKLNKIEDSIIATARDSLWENGPRKFFSDIVRGVEELNTRRYKFRDASGDELFDFKVLGSQIKILYDLAGIAPISVK